MEAGRPPASGVESSERRARALRAYAVQLGVEPEKVTAELTSRFGPRMAATALATGEDVWADDALSARERSLIILALLSAQGAERRMRGHVRLALANGLTPEELEEMVGLLGVYIGLPRASAAIELIADELAQAGRPIPGIASPAPADAPKGRVRRLLRRFRPPDPGRP